MLQHIGQLLRAACATGGEAGLVAAKQHITQGDDHAPLGLFGGQVGQLALQQCGTGVGIGGGLAGCIGRVLGIGGLALRRFCVGLRLLCVGVGLVGFIGALGQLHLVALPGGAGHIGLGCFLFHHLLREGNFLLGHIGQLVHLLGAGALHGRNIGLLHGVAGQFHFQRGVVAHVGVALGLGVVVAGAFQQCGAGGGRRASAQQHGNGQGGGGQVEVFHGVFLSWGKKFLGGVKRRVT